MAGEFDVEREMHRIAFRLVGGPHHGSVLLADLEASLLGVHRRARAAAFAEAIEFIEAGMALWSGAAGNREYEVLCSTRDGLCALAAQERETK